jgi:hypothetical protein
MTDIVFVQRHAVALQAEPSYEEGFQDGWYDHALGCRSQIALASNYGMYAQGYSDGQTARGSVDHTLIGPLDFLQGKEIA